MSKSAPRILIAAGGTGGHIFPAIHVARALLKQNSHTEICFIGSGRPLEEKLIEGNGFRRVILPATRIMQQGPVGIFKFFVKLPYALFHTWKLYRGYRPDVVVGMGGYVSVLPVFLAWVLGLPTWIHEAEIQPGLANKVLGLFSTKVSVAFKETSMLRDRELIHSGHPVRPELRGIAEMPAPDKPKRLLVVGGSQGARGIDEGMEALSPKLASLGLEIRHQTREENCERLRTAYSKAGIQAKVEPFISDMPAAYGESDLLISRAGAGAISEIGVVNRPAILVPYPYAQGGHQRGNASVLVRAGKAVMVEEGEGFAERLFENLTALSAPERYRTIRAAPVDTASLGAADTIAAGILSLIRG